MYATPIELLASELRMYLSSHARERVFVHAGGISAKTVEAHVSAVLGKLQLSTRHELSRWAVERRLVE